MTTESLAYYGQASIDHVVVDEQLANDLTEPLAEGSVAARVRDADNDRVTLVFTSSRLRSLMAPPWDPGVFFAGLAAELAAVPRDALVISPGGDFVLPPASYLDAIGESLTGACVDRYAHPRVASPRVHSGDAAHTADTARHRGPGLHRGGDARQPPGGARGRDRPGRGCRPCRRSGGERAPPSLHGGEPLVVAPPDQPAGGEHRSRPTPSRPWSRQKASWTR